MPYQPSDAQQHVIDSDAPVTVVLGGAGSGKTTTAAAAAGRRLEALDQSRQAVRARTAPGTAPILPAARRILFISFSRTAVSQILDRSAGILGRQQNKVDVVTFHGLAWRILTSFGRYYGLPHPLRVQSAAEASLSAASFPGMTYAELLPAAADLLQVPTVRDYYERRYGTVICDEFQDTSDEEWAFLQSVAPSAQRILLGDPNQCIYAGMKNIDPYDRVAQAAGLPGAVEILLPPLSHRDPTGVLPAAALAAMERRFDDPAIAHASSTGRIVLHHLPPSELPIGVAEVVRAERAANKTVSIFTHTHAATAELSTRLTQSGITHEQVGFTEAFGDSLQAQFAFLQWALEGTGGPRKALAVYVQSISRGSREKRLPPAIIRREHPGFEAALKEAALAIKAAARPAPDFSQLLTLIGGLHSTFGFPRGEETWAEANRQLRRALRLLDSGGTFADVATEVGDIRGMTLVGSRSPRPKPVQLMNLHQTKGRESDATVLVLQPDEYHGRESEPFTTGSRLLYVCLTRARERAHIVLPEGETIHGLWSPFIDACVLAQLL
ncbi:UvrD-helicase domain-containing protein [Georgenia yuyongxinii]|uniref:ATP-dependent helicase n=1 Tax=Georgenia yuyongxinii TaxID=2589797 RepID=A0A552WXD1_9MICO|nr:UvrD-helicase domain-containing protein [Georgenia yuyongxinii]TRW47437.1 ATP-dependent helicase [Georgenia yuyongxinii]